MSLIPRQVHVIWIQGEDHLSRVKTWWKDRKATWAKWMPKWKMRVWDDTSIQRLFDDPTYAPLEALYRAPNAPMAWKADVARYMLVHKHGGMYADITYEIIRNFDWMLHGKGVDFVFVHNDVQDAERDMFMLTNNCWFAATAGHPVLAAVLQRLAQVQVPATFSIHTIFHLTGPQQLWNAIEPFVPSPRVRAIPAVALDPSITPLSYKPCASGEACRTALPSAVAIHHSQMSYISPMVRFGFHAFQVVRRNYLPFLTVLAVLLVTVIAVTVAITRSLTRKYHRCQRTCGLG